MFLLQETGNKFILPSPAPLYKRIKNIRDEGFDVDKIHQYSLSIYLGSCDCQVAVLDTSTKRLLVFEDYIFNGQHSSENQLSLLKKLLDSHHFLHAGFWKNINFVVKNSKFVQVPAPLFSEAYARKYLKLNVAVNSEEVLHFRHKNCGVVTVFSIPSGIFKWMKSQYKNSTVNFCHQAVSLMEGFYADSQHQDGPPPLYLYIDRFKLHITLIHNGKLVYYNQFAIKEFVDYIKCTMLVFKMMKMDAQTSRVVVLGYIKKKSPHLTQFSKYIKNVSLGGRPNHLKFGYAFDEMEDHNFFDLYSGYLLLQ